MPGIYRINVALPDSTSPKAFEYFYDILTKQRLYCSTYNQLNDPYEGIFGVKHPELGSKGPNVEYFRKKDKFWENHKKEISKFRLCSLSKKKDKILMWSHYAGGFKGYCIEIDVPCSAKNFYPVKYKKSMTKYKFKDFQDYLTIKINCWKDEEEVRYLTKNKYLDVSGKEGIKISKIFLGQYVDSPFISLLSEPDHFKYYGLASPLPNGTIQIK